MTAEHLTVVITAAIALTGIISAFIVRGQWKVMQGQLNEMKSAGAYTKTAADAAMLAAKAAIGVELPKLFVKKIDYAPRHSYLEAVYGAVEITITNYGRTPAFVFRESAEYRIGPALDSIPDYLNRVDREPGTVIHSGGEYKITARGADRTSEFLRASFDNGEQILWIYGIIYYRDFLSESHPFKFCARLYSVRGEGETRMPRFIQDGPEAYANSV